MTIIAALERGEPSRANGRVSPSDIESLSAHIASAHEPSDASQTRSPDDPMQTTPRSHLATRFLRKSASADSCIAQRSPTQADALTDGMKRDDALSSLVEPSGPLPERADSRTLSSPPSVMSLSGYLRSKVGRRRGASHTCTTDNETSAQEDSDIDRSNIASGTVKDRVRARLLSLKSSRAAGSCSEACTAPSLPVRGASTISTNRKASNSSTSKSSQKSVTSSQALNQTSLKEITRARSHSVGPPPMGGTSKMVKRFSFGNQTPGPKALQEISFAVVGAAGCGKSTFVRKGLRKHDLSTPESLTGTVTTGDTTRNVCYIRRMAHFLTGFNTDTTLSVFEYDSADWKADTDAPSLSVWPSGLPPADGVFVCYDGSDRTSFVDVIKLVSGYKSLGIPTLVIACKADLEKRVPPEDAAIAVDAYSKLIEVSSHSDDGKRRMRKAIDWLVKQVVASRSSSQVPSLSDADQQMNLPLQRPEGTKGLTLVVQTAIPKSPAGLGSPTSPPISSIGQSQLTRTKSSASSSSFVDRSPTKASSMHDIRCGYQNLLVSSPYDSERDDMTRKSVTSSFSFATKTTESFVDISLPASPTPKTFSNSAENVALVAVCDDCSDKERRKKTRSPPTPWVTLDELLEKVFFVAISGDDPSFIAHFFLTYRRFTTPRSILLGIQKRLNELRKPNSDVVLSCFAQMRICHLLEQWAREYPSDFAVPGTHGALDAVIRHVLSYSHTLSYGCDLLPFIDILGTLSDEDAAWALKADVSSVSDSDTEADSMLDAVPGSSDTQEPACSISPEPSRASTSEPASSPRSSNRERRSSLPLSAIARIKSPIINALYNTDEQNGPSPKEILSKLQRTAATLSSYEAEKIANEITRREMELFLKIKPRDWLRHTFISGKKDPNTDPIAKFNANYNDLHEWAVSLILCHDKPKGRARQIEKLAEVASKLRMLNNYSGLRALITAINQATYPGDQPMEIFKTKVDLHKKFLSSDILLRTTGAHQSYRMALRNTKGPCIPSLEVHTSDLRRANEGNADTKPDDTTKINWAKYSMMGRFIEATTLIQQRCIGPNGYKFVEHKYIGKLFGVPVLDYETQQSRIAQPPDDDSISSLPSSSSIFSGSHAKESRSITQILKDSLNRY